MIDDPQALPKKIGRPILAAWNAKEDLLDLLALAHTQPDRHVIADRLFRFYDRRASSELPGLERLATRWRPGGARSSPFSAPGSPTPAPTAPTASSRPSPATPTASATRRTQRSRTRCATTRRARGCLNPAQSLYPDTSGMPPRYPLRRCQPRTCRSHRFAARTGLDASISSACRFRPPGSLRPYARRSEPSMQPAARPTDPRRRHAPGPGRRGAPCTLFPRVIPIRRHPRAAPPCASG